MNIKLKGRIFLTFDIEALSGLHIGGSGEGIIIGGVDKTVIRDPITNRPYIPGSSLRGKMRSLTEKYSGAPQNNDIGRVTIHTCDDKEAYQTCDICQIYGVPGEKGFSYPTRLIVRDVQMSEASTKALDELRTDLPYTEVKTEVAIDRVTSAANPRQMERVPAGTIFEDAQLVYSLYDGEAIKSSDDLERFKTVITGLQLLEDDYLGGLGSRGSGRVALKAIRVGVKASENYDHLQKMHEGQPYETLAALVKDFEALKSSLKTALKI